MKKAPRCASNIVFFRTDQEKITYIRIIRYLIHVRTRSLHTPTNSQHKTSTYDIGDERMHVRWKFRLYLPFQQRVSSMQHSTLIKYNVCPFLNIFIFPVTGAIFLQIFHCRQWYSRSYEALLYSDNIASLDFNKLQ